MSEDLRIAPGRPTPEMLGAAERARIAGKDFNEQYVAALAAFTPETGRKQRSCPVSNERGEDLLAALEDGMSSLVGRELFQLILEGNKRRTLRMLREEGMDGQDAQDLYAYCRHKWSSKPLAIVEIPRQHVARIAQETKGYGKFLVRQGLHVVQASLFSSGRVPGEKVFLLPSGNEIALSEVSQLWTVEQCG